MPLEINLAWLWLIGIVAFVVLAGWVWQGRRDDQASNGSYCLKNRLHPDPLELFHQRQRKRHIIFKRDSHLN